MFSGKISFVPQGDRFITVDGVSGEVIDDAQGYGFKSLEGAKAAWAWKVNRSIEYWVIDNMEFVVSIQQAAGVLRNMGLNPNEYLSNRTLSDILREYGVRSVPFRMEDIKNFILSREGLP